LKIGLISDVHGDATALELSWSHLMVLGADAIVCAGDVVGYGPQPDRVAAFLREYTIPTVRGNHDRWAVEGGPGRPDPFGGGTPSDETHAFLKELPPLRILDAAGRLVVVAHGVPGNDMTYLVPRHFSRAQLRALLVDVDADLLVVGHSHIPGWYRCDRGLIVNPGSVLSARPGVSSSRSFALADLANDRVTFHDVESGALFDVSHWPESS
jgi:putative phosphoesterase